MTSEAVIEQRLPQARNELKQMLGLQICAGERCSGSGGDGDAGDCFVRARCAGRGAGGGCELPDGCCFAEAEGGAEYVSGIGT